MMTMMVVMVARKMSETSCGNGHGSGTKLLYKKINAMQTAKQELRLHEMATDVERLCY
jgi:hypothetical protein